MSSLIPNISIGLLFRKKQSGENSPLKQVKETVLSAVEAVENGHPGSLY